MKYSKHIYYNLTQQIPTILGLNDSNGIVMHGMEYVKFPKHTTRINALTNFNILILFIPLCNFTLSIPITIEHNQYVVHFKKRRYVFGHHNISLNLLWKRPTPVIAGWFAGP